MKKTYLLTITAILSLALLAPACKDDDSPEEIDPCHEANTTNEWGYDDLGGPACWNDVCCGTGCSGNSQSPINIVGAVPKNDAPELLLHGSETKTTIVNKGHTIEFEQEPGTYIDFGETENGLLNQFTLGQFHFHAQSEHQIGGTHAPLEVHMVCRSVWKDEYIVLSVMFEEGDSNPLLAQFVDHLPEKKTDPHYENEDLVYNPFELLPNDLSHYSYSGSLTTPPCSEVVHWIVMENKVQASAAEIKAFTDLLHHNFRPVQPLNGRVISHIQY